MDQLSRHSVQCTLVVLNHLPQLLSRHHYLASSTVPQEHTRLTRPYEDATVGAEVYRDLCAVIQQVDGAVLHAECIHRHD